MAVTSVTATIPAGESLSNGVDISSGQLVRLYVPDQWLSSVLTFQVSSDGIVPYRNVFLHDGMELRMEVVSPGSAILVPELMGKGLAFIKLRSGTYERPVIQPLARAFQLILS
jgi:hypothetical protein